MTDSKRLAKALSRVGAYSYQVSMAAILLSVNGIDNALEFVAGLQAKGLTSIVLKEDTAREVSRGTSA